MIVIEHRRGPLWAIRSTSYSPVLREECKLTPGMSWSPPDRSWVGYADAVHVAANRARRRGLRIVNAPNGVSIPTLLVADKDLRPYQVEGVRFLVNKAAEGALLSDEVAMGKTAQAIRAARAFKEKTVVVCPSYVRGVWEREIALWWPAATVELLYTANPGRWLESVGHTTGLPKVDALVIHYDILHVWVEPLTAWGVRTLILDEIQFCQGANTRRTKACSDLARAAIYRIGLTGTPPVEKVKNLWSAVNVLSEGRFGMRPSPFYLRYCDAKKEQVSPTKVVWKFDGSSNLDELKERLEYSPQTPWGFMLRRLRSEVTLQLPAKQRQILDLEVKRPPTYSVKHLNQTVLRAGLADAATEKIPQVVDLTIGHLEAGCKIVVGSYRKAIANSIATEVGQRLPVKIGVVTGDQSLVERERLIKSEPDLLCCTFDSTAVGIDLSFATIGVVAELDYSPMKILQWEGRFGRKKGRNVLFQYIVAKGTMDEVVKRVVLAKLDRVGGVVRGEDKLKEDLTAIDGPGGIDRLKVLFENIMREDE